MLEIEMKDIKKTFTVNSARALKGVNLCISPGLIHGLLGENAAGKSTLMKILCGVHHKDSGAVMINGKEAVFNTPREALDKGIGMVYQHFRLIDELTVYENIVLGNETKPLAPFRKRAEIARVKRLLDNFKLNIPINRRTGSLSVGQKQLVEIIRMLYKQVKILILDEPTAVLSEFERIKLFESLHYLKEKGIGIIFITHKLNEATAICDDITVLKNGRNAYFTTKKTFNHRQLSLHMMGSGIPSYSKPQTPITHQEQVLKIESLSMKKRGYHILRNIDLIINSHEITGIAALAGNGQLQLLEATFGTQKNYSGEINYLGRNIRHLSTKQLRERGMNYIPEDRLFHGSALGAGLYENIVADTVFSSPYSGFMLLKNEVIKKRATQLVERYSVHTKDITLPIGMLSGGNIQKAIIARETTPPPTLLLINEPTRGLDSRSIIDTYNLLETLKQEGTALVIASSDVDELFRISDRMLVMFEGRIVYETKRTNGKWGPNQIKTIVKEHMAGIFEAHDRYYLRTGNKYEA